MKNLTSSGNRIVAVVMLTVLFAPGITAGQQTTEQFIPIGQSPGISDKYSYIGSITAVNQDAGTIDVRTDRGSRTIKVVPATRIWLDRSKARKTNLDGDYSDCQTGRYVEVMYDHDDHSIAVWIKIEAV